MVSERSLISIAGAALLVATMAPLALSQSTESEPQDPAPAATVEEPATAEDTGTETTSNPELESILEQLAALTLRVDDLEAALAVAPEPVVDSAPVEADLAKPKAPKASGKTALKYADNDPNPKRGLVTWKDRATDEDGYRLYAKRVYCDLAPGVSPDQALDYDDFAEVRSGFVRVGKAGADATEFRPVHKDVRAKLPPIPGQQYGSGEIYEIFAAAFNEAGESKKVKLGSYMITPEFMCP